MPFSPIWDAMTAHFFTSASLSRIAAMNEAECQVEGWWKGEIIWLLGQLKKTGAVKAWDRECRSVNGRQDFEIELANTIAGIEVKNGTLRIPEGPHVGPTLVRKRSQEFL